MTVNNFLLKKGSDLELEKYFHDKALNSDILPIIREWLKEFALINCAEQRVICDDETGNLDENPYAKLTAKYPEI